MLGSTRIDEDRGKDGANTRRPPGGEHDSHEKRTDVSVGLLLEMDSLLDLEKWKDLKNKMDSEKDDQNPSDFGNPGLILAQ